MGKPVVAIVVLSLMTVQVVVPTVALVMPDKPTRLGWQMYSGVGAHEVAVQNAEGTNVEVPWQEVLARTRRPELDWTQHLPEHLCTVVDESQLTVTVGSSSRTVTC